MRVQEEEKTRAEIEDLRRRLSELKSDYDNSELILKSRIGDIAKKDEELTEAESGLRQKEQEIEEMNRNILNLTRIVDSVSNNFPVDSLTLSPMQGQWMSVGREERSVDYVVSNNRPNIGDISRNHMSVNYNNNHDILVRDNNSTNGTFVNRARIRSGQLMQLEIGDIVTLGQINERPIVFICIPGNPTPILVEISLSENDIIALANLTEYIKAQPKNSPLALVFKSFLKSLLHRSINQATLQQEKVKIEASRDTVQNRLDYMVAQTDAVADALDNITDNTKNPLLKPIINKIVPLLNTLRNAIEDVSSRR